jgi:hypothetical protein
MREPQNEAGPSRCTDEATDAPEARGNLPPWHHLPGGFYEWYRRPGRFDDEEQLGDEENVPEQGSNEDDGPERGSSEDDDMDYLVTRTRRYKRGS